MNALDLFERDLKRAIAAGFARHAQRIAKSAEDGITVVAEKNGKPIRPYTVVTPEAQMKLRAAETAMELARAFGPQRVRPTPPEPTAPAPAQPAPKPLALAGGEYIGLSREVGE